MSFSAFSLIQTKLVSHPHEDHKAEKIGSDTQYFKVKILNWCRK